MLNHEQLRELIVKPVLSLIRLYSDDAVELLMFTCAAESKGGTYLKQIKGPALGIYQMEPATHNDIWQVFLRNRTDLIYIMSSNLNAYRMPDENRMIYDLYYATAMARLHYLRVSKSLPDRNDLDALFDYYKEFYNTKLGKAKKDKCIAAYKDFITL